MVKKAARRRRKSRLSPVAIPDPENKLVTVREVLARIPVSRVTLYRMVKAGNFAKPVQLTASRIAFRWSDVLDFLNSRSSKTIRKANLKNSAA
jgi:predicted DNA-binding transcriptional regulator AlpA